MSKELEVRELYMKGREIDLGSLDGKFNTVYIPIETWRDIEKKLKALEIIKEKISDINWFKCCSSLGRYNASVPSYKQLT